MKPIPFFNYKEAFSADEESYTAIFQDVLRRGAFIQQRDLELFEKNLATYLGVKHAMGVGNATDGLIMAWRAVGLKPGDEVLFPSHTMVASPAAVHWAGGVPVPVDCGDDHMMDPDKLEAAITPRTVGIMPVQLNGRTCKMDRIRAIADKRGLVIVEDSAQALGSKFKGQFASTFGVAAAFSFYPAKVLGCFGDGGAVVTNDDEVFEKLQLLRDHGRGQDGDVHCWGLNSRLDNLQAAILDFQLARYDDVVARRRAIAARYQSLLGSVPQLLLPPRPDADPDHFDIYQNYEIEASDRDGLREHLASKGIGTIIQWGGKAVHQWSGLGFEQKLPRTELLFSRCLMLPMNMTVTDDEVDYVAETIREFYGA
jgi:dTDP-4-amino-4,6-dideoxygalactose transaminase